jgi:SAM-dependent methyltransferase
VERPTKLLHVARRLAAVAALVLVTHAGPAVAEGEPASASLAPTERKTPDVIYVPTPPEVVDAMLDLARVGKGDVVYDLGCGDGRIVVAAAKRGAKRAVGVDIDPARIQEANANVRSAGVQDRVKIVDGDLFEMDLGDATVVTLYLLPSLNLRLRPKLLQLRPGTRIVSNSFDMGDWKPDATKVVEGRTVYFWTVPPGGVVPTASKH